MAQGLRASQTSLNSNVHQPPGFLPRTHRKAARCSQQICRAHSLDSVDAGSESEEDKRLSRELDLQISKKIDPQRNAKLADHLNLLWSVSQRKQPEQCDCCRGSGELECGWCHGTGAMTVGDTLYCSEGGCMHCPICKGTGGVKCVHCVGTGKRAAWMSPKSGFRKP